MAERGLKPDIISVNTVIHSLGSAGMIEEMAVLFSNIKDFGIKPDATTFTYDSNSTDLSDVE